MKTPSAMSRKPNPRPTADATHVAHCRSPLKCHRARKVTLELRDTPKEPEVDALDLDSFSPRLQCVSELVQQERSEKEEGGRDGQCQVLTVGEARVLRRKDGHRERPDDQREHDQPTPVDTDPDTGDSAQLEGRIHSCEYG
jgi:hypothetical protein